MHDEALASTHVPHTSVIPHLMREHALTLLDAQTWPQLRLVSMAGLNVASEQFGGGKETDRTADVCEAWPAGSSTTKITVPAHAWGGAHKKVVM